MSALFQKVAQYLANEVITPALAKSKTFQRAALKTHEQVEKIQKQGLPVVEKARKEAAGEVGEFFSTLKSELSKPAPKKR
jgi:hypothetical protein